MQRKTKIMGVSLRGDSISAISEKLCILKIP